MSCLFVCVYARAFVGVTRRNVLGDGSSNVAYSQVRGVVVIAAAVRSLVLLFLVPFATAAAAAAGAAPVSQSFHSGIA